VLPEVGYQFRWDASLQVARREPSAASRISSGIERQPQTLFKSAYATRSEIQFSCGSSQSQK
jgi:hypothetical protein